jgi:phosphate-selective porin OprO and OprP
MLSKKAKYGIKAMIHLGKKLFPIYSNFNNWAKKASAWAVGFNWYLNDSFKLLINYENTSFESVGTNFALLNERVVLTRLQVAF